MRLDLNINGFGIAVVQRLCKTSAKKNLYWEIKDKVIEEQFDGTRNIKKTAKVKVYGLDSNKQERARLIEILYDRVRYHKDKFIIPILHQEMCGMQVKKSGKVEHSDNTHDDNVFSYLMALHVWYDGNDLLERYGIQKNTLKTDEDLEIIEGDIDSAIEKKAKLDLHQLEYDEDDDINDLNSAYQFLEETKHFKTAKDLREETYLAETQMRENLLMTDPKARESYCKQNNIDPETFTLNTLGVDNSMITLPDNMFGGVDTDDISFDNIDSTFTRNGLIFNNNRANLVGNLSQYWDQL